MKSFATISVNKKARYCITCDKPATQEASFDVGEGVTLIEKYCKQCADKAIR